MDPATAIKFYFETKKLTYASKKTKDFFDGKSNKSFKEMMESHIPYESFTNLRKEFQYSEKRLLELLKTIKEIEIVYSENKEPVFIRYMSDPLEVNSGTREDWAAS